MEKKDPFENVIAVRFEDYDKFEDRRQGHIAAIIRHLKDEGQFQHDIEEFAWRMLCMVFDDFYGPEDNGGEFEIMQKIAKLCRERFDGMLTTEDGLEYVLLPYNAEISVGEA